MNLNEFVILRLTSKAKIPSRDMALRPRTAVPLEPEIKISDIQLEKAKLSKRDIIDLSRSPDVALFAPNIPMRLHEPVAREDIISTPKAGATWGIEATGADRSPFTGHGITLAVLDTGIDSGHIAFNGIEILQRDFTGEGSGDDNGHGTHVCGTIFGRTVEGVRIGIASGIKQALVGKVLGSQGGGTTSMITEAIHWALQHGANVISMSLGMDFPGYVDQLVQSDYPADLATSIALEGYRANINLFNTLGMLAQNLEEFLQPAIILAAAGNESKRSIDPNYEIAAAPPAAAQGILAVGALEKLNGTCDVATFSNTGPDICAPGVNIISARSGGGLSRLSGTSMATPHVTGIAVLWAERLTVKGALTAKNLTAKLIANATVDPFKEGYDPLDAGAGMVQAPLEE